MYIARRVVFSSLLLFGCVTWQLPKSRADETPAQEKEKVRVQAQIRELVSAGFKGDVDTVLKFTHPKIIDMFGSRAKAREILGGTLTKILTIGMKVEDFKFPAPPTFLRGTENEFVIVPTKTIVSVKEKRAESLNYQFGARPIGNSEWTYIEGSRVNRENVGKLFPDFPKDYEFPAFYRKLLP